MPKDPKEICGKILFTGYMKSQNSSDVTRLRAEELAKEINATHISADISGIIDAFNKFGETAFNKPLKFQTQGGTL